MTTHDHGLMWGAAAQQPSSDLSWPATRAHALEPCRRRPASRPGRTWRARPAATSVATNRRSTMCGSALYRAAPHASSETLVWTLAMETQGFTNECVVQLQQLVQTLPGIAIRTRHRQVELQVRRIVFTELSAQWAQCDEIVRASTPAPRSTVSRWQSMTAGIRSCMSQHPRLLDELSSAGALGCALENKCLRLAVQQLHQIKREEQLCVRAVGTVADRQSAIAACHRCAASAASLLQCVREGCLHAAGDADDEQEDTASQADSNVDTTDGNANAVGGRSTDDVPVPQLDVDEKSRISRSESDTLKLALRAAEIPEALRTKATRLVDRLSGPRRATTAAASKIEKKHSRLKIRTADSAKFKQHVQRIRQMPVTDNGLLGCVTR